MTARERADKLAFDILFHVGQERVKVIEAALQQARASALVEAATLYRTTQHVGCGNPYGAAACQCFLCGLERLKEAGQ